MGVSSIAPAFPRIADALELSSREVGLLLTLFTVPGAGYAYTTSFPLLLLLRFFQGVEAVFYVAAGVPALMLVLLWSTGERPHTG